MSLPSSSPMDDSFYQQLQLSPPASPKQGHHPAALCYYPAAFPPPPPFVMTDNPSPPPKADGGERVVVVARKDRHSKISTAGGMRDRRMRLSLDVAHRFFALQDKLGFDKASKTVQWLLDMSRAGIKELMMSEDGPSPSGSGTTKQHDVERQITMDFDSDRKKQRPIKAGKRAAAAPRKSNAASSSVDKESRARARERAKERTKERNRLRSISNEEAPPPNMPSPVEDVIPAFEHSSYCHQDQWELSGVVFAKLKHASTDR